MSPSGVASRVLVSHRPLALLDGNTTGFQSQIFFSLYSQYRTPRLVSLTWGSDPSLLWGDLHSYDTPPTCGSLHQRCRFWLDCVSDPPTHLSVAFSLCLSCRKSVLLVFRLFSEIVVLYLVVVWVCPREEVSSESSYLAILDTPPPFHSFSNCSFDFYHLLLNSSLLRFYEQVIITVSIMSIILWISKWKINIEKWCDLGHRG